MNAITNVEENVEPLEKMRALLGHSDRQQGRRTRRTNQMRPGGVFRKGCMS